MMGGVPGEILFVPTKFLSSHRSIMKPILGAKTKNIIVGGDEEGNMQTSAREEDPRTYRMVFPSKGGPRSCPVEGCPG